MPDQQLHIESATRSTSPLIDIDLFLMSSQFLELDREFGMQQMNIMLQELAMAQAGGKRIVTESIRQRSLAAMPRLIVSSDNATGFNLVNNWDMMDGNVPAGSIALLKLSGVMRTQSGFSSPGIDRLANDLRMAYNNTNIRGVILETLSGGGESMAGNVLKSALSERNKPVIGWGHLVASAAFRALTGTDEIIMSSQSAEVGSIGTMISMDTKELNKFRERFTEFYGKDAPNKNGEFRKANAGDFSAIQERVDKLTVEFHNEIKRDRSLQGDSEKIKETLSGAMFNAIEGKKRGLVDGIGALPYAVKRVNALQSKY
ncbi:MAG: S49 family peptidase [Shewanella sp.]